MGGRCKRCFYKVNRQQSRHFADQAFQVLCHRLFQLRFLCILYFRFEFPHNNMMYHCIFLLCFCFIANSHSFCANTSLLLRLFACNPQNILNLFHGHVKIRGKLCHTEIHVIAVGEFLDGVF